VFAELFCNVQLNEFLRRCNQAIAVQLKFTVEKEQMVLMNGSRTTATCHLGQLPASTTTQTTAT